MLANTYLPADAADVKLVAAGNPIFLQEEEFDRPVTMGLLEAESGQEAEVTTSYTRPGATTTVDGASEFRVDYEPQPSIRPVTVTVRIQAPADATITAAAPGIAVDGRTATYTGQPTIAVSLWIRFVSPETT
jgi:hypothetical protein